MLKQPLHQAWTVRAAGDLSGVPPALREQVIDDTAAGGDDEDRDCVGAKADESTTDLSVGPAVCKSVWPDERASFHVARAAGP
jgi:hypothetical protein